MNDIRPDGPNRRSGGGTRRGRNTYVTKSGQTIKVHRNIGQRMIASKEALARRRAARLAGMPKSPVKRFFYRLHPKRLYAYWFSREGAIMALKICGIGIIAGFLLMVGIFAYFRKDLPNLKDISGSNIGGSIRYYDKTGQTLLWEDYDAVKRIPVKDEDISQFIKDATVAIEDKDFVKHGGFDVRGIIRAGISDVTSGTAKQGGSTITQQLVKLNNDWTKDRTVTRKVKELILAVELERSYSKKEILAGYLNAAPYGNVQYGVEAAARDYFDKPAKDLTLDEAAFLAAIPQAPSYYSPYGPSYNPEALKGRQGYILDQMLKQGLITSAQHQEAKKIDTLAKYKTPKQKFAGIIAPYFVLTAKQQMEDKFGDQTVKRGGWKVTTTLDMNLQNLAEQQVQKGLAQVKRQGGNQIAFAAEDVKTGQMVALVGGVDFKNEVYGQNNYARLRIPPGSSFKPYDYAALIENTTNFGAGSVLYDVKGPIDGYPCTTPVSRTGNCAIDYDLRFPGPLTIRYALGGSRNIPAMKAMLIAGVDKTIGTAKKLMMSPGSAEGEARGNYKCYYDEELTKEAPCYTASSIGDGAYLKLDEHVHGFATLSRNGLNIPQTYILKIEDAAGKIVDEWKPSKGVQAVRPETAYIIDDILADPRASYLATKSHNYKGWKFGFKTGTTNDSKDGLMLGMSTQYAVGTWVGYYNRTRPMTGFMESMTQPIVAGWMQKAHEGLRPEERSRPAGLQTLPAFVVRTHVGVGSVEPSPSTDIYPSWYKPPARTTSSSKTIDIVSNKLATDCTPARARKEVTDTSANSFSGDKFVTGGGANTAEQDDIHKCDDTRPTISIQVTPQGNNQFSIQAVVGQGTHPLSSAQFPGTVTFSIDGQTIAGGSYNVSGAGTVGPFTYTANFSGSKTITATVVDSVLYDATDSTNITATGGGGANGGDNQSLTIARPANIGPGETGTTINWSGGSPGFILTVLGPTGARQTYNTSNRSQRINTFASGRYEVTVRDAAGNTDSTSFRKSSL